MKKWIGTIFTLLMLTALPAKSQTGTNDFTIEVNRIENSFTVKPIEQLYIWRELQTRYDSSITKEAYYKRIVAQKDTIIKEQQEDNTQLRVTLSKVEPAMVEKDRKNVELQGKNNKLKLGIGGLLLALAIETFILFK